VNLDFTKKSVLSSFRLNTSIEQLFDENDEEMVGGRVAGILERKIRLRLANKRILSEQQHQRMIPLGMWANGIASIVGNGSLQNFTGKARYVGGPSSNCRFASCCYRAQF
jgi:hypothetical protein